MTDYSEETSGKKANKSKVFCDKGINMNLEIGLGAVLTGAETLISGAKSVDTKVTKTIGGLLENVSCYLRNSKDKYKKD